MFLSRVPFLFFSVGDVLRVRVGPPHLLIASFLGTVGTCYFVPFCGIDVVVFVDLCLFDAFCFSKKGSHAQHPSMRRSKPKVSKNPGFA